MFCSPCIVIECYTRNAIFAYICFKRNSYLFLHSFLSESYCLLCLRLHNSPTDSYFPSLQVVFDFLSQISPSSWLTALDDLIAIIPADSHLEDVEQDVKRIKYDIETSTVSGTPKSLNLGSFRQISSPVQIPASNTTTVPQVTETSRLPERSEAIRILRQVPVPLFHSLVDLWFKECQPWFPILKRSKLEQSLAALTVPVERIDDIVLRALIALSFNHSSAAIAYGYSGRRQVSSHLRAEVLIEAMAKVSLESLQALLIIAIMVSPLFSIYLHTYMGSCWSSDHRLETYFSASLLGQLQF